MAKRVWSCSKLGMLACALMTFGCEDGGTMEVHNLDPRVGGLQGEQAVKVHGKNFRTDIGYTVHFGNKKAGNVTILDPNTLLVTTPSRDQPGEVTVNIRADDGSAFELPQAFHYEDMGGSVVENLGETPMQDEKARLPY